MHHRTMAQVCADGTQTVQYKYNKGTKLENNIKPTLVKN